MGSGDSFSCICRDGWEGRTCTHSELEGLQVGEACGFCVSSPSSPSLLPTASIFSSTCPPHTSTLCFCSALLQFSPYPRSAVSTTLP